MNKQKIIDALREACKAATDTKHETPNWYERMEEAERILHAVDEAYSFNEYTCEHGDPDYALEDMEYLDELAECGGDWGKPSYVLARAFYGHRYSRFANEPDHKAEEFNPNDEYFTFNGYGNLVSVNRFDWGHYWASILDEDGYINAAEDEGHLEAIAEALGIEDEDEEDGE